MDQTKNNSALRKEEALAFKMLVILRSVWLDGL